MEARSEESELGGSFCDSVASDFGEVIGTGTGEDETVQGKACTAVQLQEVADFQESLRGAVVGPLENIPCRIEGLLEDGAKFIEGVAHSLEAWPAAKYSFKDALVLNKERELVEQVVGENNSLMSVGVGNGLGGRAEVERGSLPCNIKTTSHLPKIKVVHAKSYHAFNAGSSFSRVKENEELLFAGGFLGHAGSLGRLGVSCGSGPVHEQEHSGMWEFANNVVTGL